MQNPDGPDGPDGPPPLLSESDSDGPPPLVSDSDSDGPPPLLPHASSSSEDDHYVPVVVPPVLSTTPWQVSEDGYEIFHAMALQAAAGPGRGRQGPGARLGPPGPPREARVSVEGAAEGGRPRPIPGPSLPNHVRNWLVAARPLLWAAWRRRTTAGGGRRFPAVPWEPVPGSGATVSYARSGSAECPICLARFEQGDLVCTLRCSHNFHEDCIGRWVSRCDARDSALLAPPQSSARCPLCRDAIGAGAGGEAFADEL